MARRSFIFLCFILLKIVNCRECDAETECSDDETCCKLGINLWGCCPMEMAVCCDDHTHCCPQGTICDTKGGRCIHREGFKSEMKKKKMAKKTMIRNEFNEIICPDKSSKCPDGSTCCMLEEGNYGCCPVPNAVCCADMLHCCPHGFTCHGQFCSQKYANIPHLQKFKSTSIYRKPAIEFIGNSENQNENDSNESNKSDEEENDFLPPELRPISCGYGKTCPAKSTCCQIEQDNGIISHMCCPLSNAVCCQNTCCPAGYHCIKGGKCEKHAVANTNFYWNQA